MPIQDTAGRNSVTAGPPEAAPLALSVVIPAFNEEDNVLPLLDEIESALKDGPDYEVIFVDDASTDATGERLLTRKTESRHLRVIRHGRRGGQSAALRSGIKAARAPWIVTMDGDGQNDPADIPTLLALRDRPAEVTASWNKAPLLVGGLRIKRNDTWSRRLASRGANLIRQSLLNDRCSDSGCGLKLFCRETFLDLPYFGAMHRFLPALYQIYGHAVAFTPVNHRPRQRGKSKYGNFKRGLIGLVDLIGVRWLKSRTPVPTEPRELHSS